ncbi:hypothetical protein QBB34_47695 [Streptomyces stelliscabiei]|uniref:hypothetical protein n=1 Tax=Streptomyces stelliscabiei TaxID=146820 RepID=UPI002FEFD9C1
MTRSSFPSSRARRTATVASTLIVIALPAILLVLIVGPGVPQSWWPQTGQAFAADSRSSSTRQDPCDLIVGPAKEYCERGHHHSGTSTAHEAARDGTHAAWMLIPLAAGLAALLLLRRRHTAGHGRR